MGQRITIDFGSGGLSISGDPFEQQQPKKNLDEILDNSDPLLSFLKEEVKVDEYSDDVKIPDNAPIRLAEYIADHFGGDVKEYLTLPQHELERLYIKAKNENPTLLKMPNEEKQNNNELRKAFNEEQMEILKQKITNNLYDGTEDLL